MRELLVMLPVVVTRLWWRCWSKLLPVVGVIPVVVRVVWMVGELRVASCWWWWWHVRAWVVAWTLLLVWVMVIMMMVVVVAW